MMENMDKGLLVPKSVLIVLPKIPQTPWNLSAQFVCPSQKVLDFNEKKASLGVRSPLFGPCSKAKQEGGVNLSEPVVRSSTRMSKSYSREKVKYTKDL